jgi:hypothetical protein
MRIRFNKGFSIILSIVIVTIYLFGLHLVVTTMDLFQPDKEFDFNWINVFITNLSLVFSKLDGIIIGLWFLFNSKKFNQDKWTWILIGLVYGQFSLILFGLIIIIQNIKSNINLLKSLNPIILLLTVTFLLNMGIKPLTMPYLTSQIMSVENYGLLQEYSAYLHIATYFILILLNIIFAFRLGKWIKSVDVYRKSVWIFATVVFGLFPVIILNEIVLVKRNNKNALHNN